MDRTLLCCRACGQLVEAEPGESRRGAAEAHVRAHLGDPDHPEYGQIHVCYITEGVTANG